MDEKIYTVIANVLCGEATEEEQLRLGEWLREEEGHQKTFDDIKELWDEADTLVATPVFNKEAAWTKIAPVTVEKTAPRVIAMEPKRFTLPAWLKVNIGVAAALLVGFFMYQSFYYYGSVEVVAGTDNQEVILPDDSHITLHSGSSITYPRHFDKNERHVALNGEAFFSVTRNEHVPFTIDAHAANVQVLGTSFNVSCNGDKAVVTVKTGKVSVKNSKKENEVILTPGEQSVVNGATVTKASVSTENYLYWKTGILDLTDLSFEQAVKEVAPYLKKAVSFDASVTPVVKQQPININLKKQSVEEALSEMCLIANCSLTAENTQYIIRMK